jgi:hypothetical protein
MAYRIKRYTFEQAKKLGVEVKPSKVKGKKIDVFKNGEKVASVGALGMNDYPTYLEKEKEGGSFQHSLPLFICFSGPQYGFSD